MKWNLLQWMSFSLSPREVSKEMKNFFLWIIVTIVAYTSFWCGPIMCVRLFVQDNKIKSLLRNVMSWFSRAHFVLSCPIFKEGFPYASFSYYFFCFGKNRLLILFNIHCILFCAHAFSFQAAIKMRTNNSNRLAKESTQQYYSKSFGWSEWKRDRNWGDWLVVCVRLYLCMMHMCVCAVMWPQQVCIWLCIWTT